MADSRIISNYDLTLMKQRSLKYKIKIEIVDNNNKIINVIEGLSVSGTGNINAESDVRRTWDFSIIPTMKNNINIKEESIIWINKHIKVYIGLLDIRTDQYSWYQQGEFIYTKAGITFDATNKTLSVSSSDKMVYLDGTKNGQCGDLKILFPAYDEDAEGNPTTYHKIRDQIITILTDMTNIKDFFIDEVGEYKGIQKNNPDYLNYRLENPQWDCLPYDQEFSVGCTILSMLIAFRDLYPNYEMFFNYMGKFICQMIPSCYEDDVIFTDSFFKKIYITENTDIDMTRVKNICQVWGQVIDADFYTTTCTLTNDVYTATVETYDEYKSSDKIAIKIPSTNTVTTTLKVNSLSAIGIYDENTDALITASKLEANNVYVFKIKKKTVNSVTTVKAYLLGAYQACGINVLTDGMVGETFTFNDNTTALLYSKEYFQKAYNCENVSLTVIPNSPFTVQKIGEILDVKHDGEYENITSDSLALSSAVWENWKNCRLTDQITITTHLIPFLDENIKVSYQSQNEDEEQQYIIKSVSNDYANMTSSITMIRFYPLYIPE